MPYIWYSYLYSVKWLHLLDKPYVLENILKKQAFFETQDFEIRVILSKKETIFTHKPRGLLYPDLS
ncbi:hypothetical protein BGV40_00840 [Methanosarcina sp. Ant1]|nr:hypothetical protein BGV40_00840 [Methanosarcina sp. Ant1]